MGTSIDSPHCLTNLHPGCSTYSLVTANVFYNAIMEFARIIRAYLTAIYCLLKTVKLIIDNCEPVILYLNEIQN